MAWNMGNAELIRALLAGKDVSTKLSTEAAAAEAVASALLRAVGRQAIIAAAADAVAALGCAEGHRPLISGTSANPATVNPGGGQGGEDPDKPPSDDP
jgi:xanthine dehydrogenase iron-sulfur cluster and FAD-binding subunit A